MRSFIPEDIRSILEKQAKWEEADDTTKKRASIAGGVIISRTKGAVSNYDVDYAPEGADAPRKSARVYIAGLLSIIGEPDINSGHLASKEVVMGHNHAEGDILFSEITLSLSNVGLSSRNGSRITPHLARSYSPDSITEGKVVVRTKRDTEPRNRYHAGEVASWLHDRPLPDRFRGRDHYVTADHLGRITSLMFFAMNNEELNPQFRTIDFVQGVSPELTDAVLDHRVPTEEFGEAFILPGWLRETA